MDFPILAFSLFILNSLIVHAILYNVENLIYVYKMEYENMKMTELKALARERGLRGYSQLRRAELVALLQNNSPPPSQMSTWEPIDDRLRPDRPAGKAPLSRPQRLRQPPHSMGSPRSRGAKVPVTPTQQEMNIFEQQEMSESQPQVKNKLNDWYDWLINHVPKPIKDGASKAFKTFKDKIMGLYNRVTGSGNQALDGPRFADTQLKGSQSTEPEPTELEKAFNGAYRSYRINGRPRMNVETFFHRIRRDLIEMIKRELNNLNSARVQTTMWIRFVREDEEGQEKVELAFNSLMTSVYRGSDLDQIVDGMIANMKFQMENPALLNSRFVFDKVLCLDANFYQLNLTRGSSYLPLPDWLARKKAIINPHNNDEKCFKWAVIAAENFNEMGKNPQ